METTTTVVTAEAVAQHLLADEGADWRRQWEGYTTLTDPYGNVVHLRDSEETVRVEVEYALGVLVETMNLDPQTSVARIARIITAATAPEED